MLCKLNYFLILLYSTTYQQKTSEEMISDFRVFRKFLEKFGAIYFWYKLWEECDWGQGRFGKIPLRTKFVIGQLIYTVKPHFTGMEACHVFSSSCGRFFYKDFIKHQKVQLLLLLPNSYDFRNSDEKIPLIRALISILKIIFTSFP